ncbi:PIN domain-containing protein [Streptomyces sp. LHD-70]|uniref:PIN domain-containing protein n=1 Tax=Streptomyces sp. LHD-70 TaxID=3072140 RepID=UPI00280C7925|nr:PIN domain-containing protein [Streptomyces sp. LHD-70]MDQ8704693.1 PIN domain-containing protein [Streptomyces sp. LHD-70]
MAQVVVYDACVLYPSTLRDLLIRIAQSGLVQAKWSDRILDEVFDNLAENRPDLDPTRLSRTRQLMIRAVRDSMVVGYEPLIDALELPDPDDRHVLAAAVKSRAHQIVTRNLHDFPNAAVAPWGVQPCHPDDFVMEQIELDRITISAAVYQIADSWRNPPGSASSVLDRLEKDGLIESVAALRA